MELDKLHGSWAVTAIEMHGSTAPNGFTEKVTVIFKGDKMVMDGPLPAAEDGKPLEFTVKLDPSETPKALDVTPLNGKFKEQTGLGIYHLEGDTLKLCFPNVEVKDRPSEFKSAEGSNLIVMTLKKLEK